MTGAERQRKYRERQKTATFPLTRKGIKHAVAWAKHD